MFKNRYLFVILTFILLAMNLFIGFQFKSLSETKKQQKEDFQGTLTSIQNENQFLNDVITTLVLNTQILKRHKSNLRESNPLFINELNQHGKLIFLYSSAACSSCLVKTYADLEILAERIGKENIITLSDQQLMDDIFMQPSKFNFFPIATLNIAAESLNQPMLFILDQELTVNHVFFPDLFEKHRQEYFTKVIPALF